MYIPKKTWSYCWNDMLFTIVYQGTGVDKTWFFIICKLYKNTWIGNTSIKANRDFTIKYQGAGVHKTSFLIMCKRYKNARIGNTSIKVNRDLTSWYCHSSYLGYWNCIVSIQFMIHLCQTYRGYYGIMEQYFTLPCVWIHGSF